MRRLPLPKIVAQLRHDACRTGIAVGRALLERLGAVTRTELEAQNKVVAELAAKLEKIEKAAAARNDRR